MPQETMLAYAHRVEKHLVALLQQSEDWTVEAAELEEMALENGLMPPEAFPLPKSSPQQFVTHLISEQASVLENSNLVNLYHRQWEPKNSETPSDLLSHLLI